MNQNHTTIHDFFSAWGRAQRHLPSNHQVLKSQILSKFSSGKVSEIYVSTRPWLSWTFAGLVVITFLITFPYASRVIPTGFPMQIMEDKIGSEYYPSIPNESEIPISDTREFLKMDYHASIRTRRVSELTERVQTIVRGYGGRVDSSSSSSSWGAISFVVPVNRFDAFRSELKDIIRARFLTENIQTENLLPQKQSVEEEQKQAAATLAQFRSDQGVLNNNHRRTIASIQSRKDAITLELTALRAEITNDPVRKAKIAAREQELINEQKILEANLAAENATYQKKFDAFTAQIRGTEDTLKDIQKEDQRILDTVATVRGTISFQWISIWGIIGLYIPAYMIIIFFLIAALVSYGVHRSRVRLVLP